MTKIATTSHRLSPLSEEPGPLERAGLLEGDASPEEVVVAYHERTKHHFHRYAASLGYMDWATQPNPFRRYAGADLLRLPLPQAGRPLPYWQLYARATVPPAPLSLESVSLFSRYALSLTAWKQVGETTWALRANPSSGNLHPTEGYALLPALEQLGETPAIYHYAPRAHALERRAVLDAKQWTELVAPFPEGSFLVGLSSVHWREAWKYGERAFRYCQHDVGPASLGWRLVLLDGVSNSTLSSLLGLDRDEDFTEAEREEAELLALIAPDFPAPLPSDSKSLTAHGGGVLWQGSANTLSSEHRVEWPVIDEVARVTRRCESSPIQEDFSGFPSEDELFGTPVCQGLLTAEKAILGRRSAVAMDGSTAISRAAFFRMLARLIPTQERRSMPWDAIPWRPHRALRPPCRRLGAWHLRARPRSGQGRDSQESDAFRILLATRAHLPDRAPLVPPPGRGLPSAGDHSLLRPGHIAGDGAFSLAMIADYMDSLATYGARFYRNLFWEAGMVGQVLYLEAEEAGIGATGIGCYFDDPVHAVFGIVSREWQSFYHFTVGGPVEDTRLSTLPAYNFEEEQ